MTTTPERKAVEKWLAQWGIHNDAEIAGLLDAMESDTGAEERLRAALDEAWTEAEAALPEDWALELTVGGHGRRDLYTATASYCYSLRHYRENVGPSRGIPFEMAHGPTPVAALRGLVSALSGGSVDEEAE